MPTTTAAADSESITDLRRRAEDLEARVAALGQAVTPAIRVKRGRQAQVGVFGDDSVYAEIVHLGRAWRDANSERTNESNAL